MLIALVYDKIQYTASCTARETNTITPNIMPINL